MAGFEALQPMHPGFKHFLQLKVVESKAYPSLHAEHLMVVAVAHEKLSHPVKEGVLNSHFSVV